MSRLLVMSCAAAALLSGAAFAAGLPMSDPPMVKDAMAAPATTYDWTGFYIGGQGGYGWGTSNIRDNISSNTTFDIEGAFAGGLAGAQWQWKSYVLGVEGEMNWSGVDGNKQLGAGNFSTTISTDINWFGSVSGKLGLAWDKFLVFGTGGVSFANIGTRQVLHTNGASYSKDAGYVGWTVGAGLDYAITKHIIVGGQYRYYDFGTESFSAQTVGGTTFNAREQRVDLHTISGHIKIKLP